MAGKKESPPKEKTQYYASIGVDWQGDPCIYLGRLDEDGDFNGDYLSEAELEVIAEKLNDQMNDGKGDWI